MRILITGYSGFLGSNLFEYLNANNEIILLGRNEYKNYNIFNIEDDSSIRLALSNIDCVIHCAAIPDTKTKNISDDTFYRTNVELTSKLCKYAADSKVRKFIFISSLKVNGDYDIGKSYSNDKQNPKDRYAKSKAAAENEIKKICRNSKMAFVIIRPPIIYGRGVKSNILHLINLVEKGIPLPFLGVNNNKRSMIYIKNLLNFIEKCIWNKNADNETFLISDNFDVSTYELLKIIADSKNKKLKLFYFPNFIIKFCLKFLNKMNIYNSLFRSFSVDSKHANTLLEWEPPYTLKEGIKECN